MNYERTLKSLIRRYKWKCPKARKSSFIYAVKQLCTSYLNNTCPEYDYCTKDVKEVLDAYKNKDFTNINWEGRKDTDMARDSLLSMAIYVVTNKKNDLYDILLANVERGIK